MVFDGGGGDDGFGGASCSSDPGNGCDAADGFTSSPNPFCQYGGPSLPPETTVQNPSCEQTETTYVNNYLSKYNSPLAQYAGFIVAYSDLLGVDDRFIVALAGVESIYGKTQQSSPTWGYYNAFSNATTAKL